MHALPLAELYDLLRANGFAIGVDDHIRIGRLLAREAAWSPEMLRIAIAALVVTNSDEQGQFDACWTRWVPHVRPTASGSDPRRFSNPRLLGTAPPSKGTRVRSLRRAVAVSSRVVLGLLGIMLVLTLISRRGDEPTAGSPATGTTDANLGDSRRNTHASDVSATPISEAASSNLINNVNGTAGSLVANGRVTASDPSLTFTIYTSVDMTLVMLILGMLVLATVAVVFAHGSRAHRRFLPGPWRYEIAAPPATNHVLPAEAVEDAAADLSWRAPGLADDIDIERSIAATAAKGGLPTFVKQRALNPLRYLVLEDVAGVAANWKFLYDELFQGLAREGLDIERYTFTGNLQWCTDANGTEATLGELLEGADALIVVSDGQTAVDPVGGGRAPWVSQLPRMPRRLWINPFPMARWSTGAREIAAETPMEHGAVSALFALRPGVQRGVPDRAIYAPVLERAPGTESAVIALRASLSARAFALVAAVSIVGGPTVALARWLAESYSLRLDEKEWLYIATLPWFGGGQWPEDLADRLGAALETDDPEFARSLRSLAQRLLAASEPPRDSAAHLQWQLDGARQAFLRGERTIAAHMLNRIATTPFARQACTALTGFGLRNRRRTVMASALTLGLVVVVGALSAGFLGRRNQAIVTKERTAKRHLVKVSGDDAMLPRPMGKPWPEPFSVKVIDGNGKPVAGAHVVWSNPQLGPRSYISDTDATGVARAAQLYKAPATKNIEQVAQLISEWNGERLMNTPIAADGDRVVFKFSQIPRKIKVNILITIVPKDAAKNGKIFLNGEETGQSTDLEVNQGDKVGLKVIVPGRRDIDREIDVGYYDDDDDVVRNESPIEVNIDYRQIPPEKGSKAKWDGLIDI